MYAPHHTPTTTFQNRRRVLQDKLQAPALIASGSLRPRQYPANTYPFRAKSHYLYLTGAVIPDAFLLLADGQTTLFVQPEEPDAALWEGAQPSHDELKQVHGLDAVRSVDELPGVLAAIESQVATLAPEDHATCTTLSTLLGRTIVPGGSRQIEDGTPDAKLADAIIAMRLIHDKDALEQLRWAADVTAQAHIAAMKAGATAGNEVDVFGAAMAVMRAQGHEDSFGPIVTMHGEILHNIHHDRPIARGGLMLVDMGSETPEGWAGDVTRTWPVSGTFSPTQRSMYEIVLAAQKACVQMVRPGVRYRSVHDKAKRVIVEGLRDLGIFHGDVDGLIERGAAALLFPHGIGHLLGLDVHDMEDLGDRAGYGPGRTRATNFGDAYLRLDRDLEPGMAVTIEPGIYLVPAIYNDERYAGPLGADFDREALGRFGDVRGIRIEDDVVVTAGEPDVLTSVVPKEIAEVEALIQRAAK